MIVSASNVTLAILGLSLLIAFLTLLNMSRLPWSTLLVNSLVSLGVGVVAFFSASWMAFS
jgi:hypothetical protein